MGALMVSISDMNGDGFRDMAATFINPAETDKEKQGFIRTISGKDFSIIKDVQANTAINGLNDIGDHDGDGKGDFAISSAQVTKLFLSTRAEPLSIKSSSTVVTAGCDIDGNGTDDIILGGGILDGTKIIEVYDGKSFEKTVLLNELMDGARERLAEDIICIKHPAGDFIAATEPEYGLRKIERLK
jgi:hypothetical protein